MRRVLGLLMTSVLLVVVLAGGLATAIAQVPVVNPDNGHSYALFFAESISWADASAQATGTDLNGCQGYLATVSSAQEKDFLVDAFGEEMGTLGYGFWLGGYQDPGVGPANYGWQWVTGEPWGYTNWLSGEPNDAYGYASEQHLTMTGSGLWNDDLLLSNIRGYIVECASDAPAQIDIKPGEPDNIISLSGRGAMQVAILSRADFHAPSQVASRTLTFGRTGDEHSLLLRKTGAADCGTWDVNADQRIDLVCRFLVKLTGFQIGDTEGILRGSTVFESPFESPFEGRDMVNIVP